MSEVTLEMHGSHTRGCASTRLCHAKHASLLLPSLDLSDTKVYEP